MIEPGILRRFAFFASFPDDQLREIADRAPRVSLPADTQVFAQGDLSATMYLILEGTVRIHRTDENGAQVELEQMGQHRVFGELALLTGEPRMAAVTTLSAATFLVIDRPMMLEIIRRSKPEELLNILAVLSQQIRAKNEEDFRKLLQQRTLEAQMEIERQRGLTQMVAGVAHELNTPLGVINTAASILQERLSREPDRRSEDVDEALRLIERNVERAHRLVQDFKKVSSSQLSDERGSFDIVEVVEETIDLVSVGLRRSGITVRLELDLEPDQRTWVGYRGYLSQILINLLTNVERYAYPDGRGGEVEVRIGLEGDDFVVSVRDHGQGILPEDQAHVFEPFFTTGRSLGGTGLGLTIVHNLVANALKGEIRFKSGEGQGTEFTVTFPRVVPE